MRWKPFVKPSSGTHIVLQIDPWCWIFGALLILTVPLVWVLSAVFSALFHELCHIWAIKMLRGRILSVRIGIGGAVIESEIPGKGKELLCAMAGPLGSLLLLALCHRLPELAICAGVQGLFNLLPVYPLDGGRALRCCLELLCPAKADRICCRIETILYFLLIILAAVAAISFSIGLLPFLIVLQLIIRAVLRKRPCKRSQIGVQ